MATKLTDQFSTKDITEDPLKIIHGMMVADVGETPIGYSDPDTIAVTANKLALIQTISFMRALTAMLSKVISEGIK